MLLVIAWILVAVVVVVAAEVLEVVVVSSAAVPPALDACTPAGLVTPALDCPCCPYISSASCNSTLTKELNDKATGAVELFVGVSRFVEPLPPPDDRTGVSGAELLLDTPLNPSPFPLILWPLFPLCVPAVEEVDDEEYSVPNSFKRDKLHNIGEIPKSRIIDPNESLDSIFFAFLLSLGNEWEMGLTEAVPVCFMQ